MSDNDVLKLAFCPTCGGKVHENVRSAAASAEPVAWITKAYSKTVSECEAELANLRAQLAEAEADTAKANENAVKAWEEREHYREYSANLDKAAHALKTQLAEEKARHALTIQHADQISAWFASARKALEEIIAANNDFRAGLPDDWEGDPLQDAIEQAEVLLTDELREGGK